MLRKNQEGLSKEISEKKKEELQSNLDEMTADKPKTEQILFRLQGQFLSARAERDKDREKKVMKELFSLLTQYSRSLILQKLKNNVFLPQNQVETLSHNVATKLIERYYRSPDFVIEGSFAGYLSCKVREELYSESEEENHLSLDQPMGVDRKQKLEGITQVIKVTPLFPSCDPNSQGPSLPKRSSEEIAREAAQAILYQASVVAEEHGFIAALRTLNGVLMYLKLGEKQSRTYLAQESDVVQTAVDTTLLVLYRRLKEELQTS